MKRLSEQRNKILFEKLAKYVGPNVKVLIERPDGNYCFREKKDRVYYLSEKLMKLSDTFTQQQLVCAGTCIGKFTKSNKFILQITALNYLAPYAQCKMWLKSSAEQQFLYGQHVTKGGMGRISENTEKYSGVVVYSMEDLPLGFGVASLSTAECKHADPMATVAFHQCDIGEYIRSEKDLL
ncbi:PREDICTED: 60S ribosome subunit biogenesis protein NIP7 homolog [Nicrophorus vespilloides]|uniref:60S ribosome subunit biogenesis protein NIP7 homolog n=1 Tax=Nicrophorus vespilloides TaxID=110193 RepID=A0ABM1MLZ0_NICVS|nr:PREDICTED: 60S ribosome subunit biogenesis protein NIP7 homolog [Nicrophorus vespilloides]